MHAAAAGLFEPCQDAQEGGLADAVRPDNGNASPLRDREGKPGEDIIRAKSFAQVGGGQKRHAMSISAEAQSTLIVYVNVRAK